MRKIILSVIFLLILSVCAFADAMLYRGTLNMGSIPSLNSTGNDSGYSVSIEDAGRLLGFTSSRVGEELILQKGNIQLRVILNSAAAWRGYSIVPLYSAPFEQNGKFWVDSLSAAALFQASVGNSQNDRLRFVKSSGSGNTTSVIASSTSRSELEFGRFDEEPRPPVATVPTVPTRTPEPTIPTRTPTTQPNVPARTPTTEPPVSTRTPATTQPTVPTTQPTVPTRTPTVQPTTTPAVTQPLSTVATTPTVQTEERAPVVVPTASRTSGGKSQPRYETFKPDDKRTERGEKYSGTIQGIRWTLTEGAHKKIRAVVTTDEGADPQVFMQNGELHALFSSSLESSSGVSSPYSNIKAELKRNANGIELIFSPTGITKAEKLVLSSPRRIAFEFFYPSSTNIVRVVPQTNQNPTVARTPEPTKPTTPSVPQKTDPIINVNPQTPTQPRTPVVQVPQTTITIPTTPVNTNPRRIASAGKKTIVIDAGHGGKDPGASDNGVVEKNVNLAISLELERELLSRGFNVVMTRRTDVYLKLQERTDIANEVNADLFVSFHVNALPSKKSATGIEIYIMALPTDKDAMNLAKVENREYVEGKGFDTANVDRRTEMLLRILGDMQQNNKISESTDFAAALYNAGSRSGLPMRRVAQAPFFVLRGAGMPAVLIEVGFVTNANEAMQLTQKAYQSKIAQAMASGIASYLN